MSASPNLICDGKFITIAPISESLRDRYYCSYSPEYRLAKSYVQHLDTQCRFSQHYCCNKCGYGWREIADRNNSKVV